MIESLLISFSFYGIIVCGILIIATNLLPDKYRLIVQNLAIALLAVFAYYQGTSQERTAWVIKNNKVIQENLEKESKAKDISLKYESLILQHEALIKQKGKVKYVTKYISKEDDNKCAIPPGFIRLHNDSVKGLVSDSPSGVNGASGRE